MSYKARLFILLISMGMASGLHAQVLEIGVGAGGAGYIGDLNQDNNFKISGISAGAYLKGNLDPYWAIGVHYNYGRIKADDLKSSNEQFKMRGLNFNSDLHELSLQMEFNFLEYYAGGGTKRFTPYIFTGIGLLFFSPKGVYRDPATDDNEWYRLRFYMTEGQSRSYRNFALAIPYGVGTKFRLKDNWGLFTQVGYRTAFTDYIDDVSDSYPRTAFTGTSEEIAVKVMLSDPGGVGTPATQRGDFRKRDSYMFVGVGISFTFLSQKCYTF
ncbi:DUF6089 family protein [Pedobacter sp. JCM 36344]|uniref:type IX secretion system protein PorG n=1 Tax=Pedobacter sp. JCM 36344 TaxID=3374280 RepID=UPI003977F3C8